MLTEHARSFIRFFIRPVLAGILLVVVGMLALSTYNRRFNLWTQPPQTIEAFLRTQTPLGAPDKAVQAWLKARGFRDHLVVAQFGPGQYPVSRTGGVAFIQTTVKQHRPWILQDEWVEAFYSFDDAGRLTDIGVRIDRDGP